MSSRQISEANPSSSSEAEAGSVIEEDEVEADITLNIVAVGDDKIGKSELLLAHACGQSTEQSQLDMIGDANYEFSMLEAGIRELGYLVEWNDITAKCYSEALTNMKFLREKQLHRIKMDAELLQSSVVFLCFSLTNKDSFDNISYHLKEIRKSPVRKAPRILVGIKNYSDQSSSNVEVESDEILHYCRNNGLLYVEVSPFTYSNVEHLFFVATQLLSKEFKTEYKRAKEAVEAAAGSEDTIPWRRCKLMVAGHEMVGKSSLVRSLLGKPFEEEWISTVGASLIQTNTNIRDGSWDETRNYGLDFTTEQVIRAGMMRYFKTGIERERRNKGTGIISKLKERKKMAKKSKGATKIWWHKTKSFKLRSKKNSNENRGYSEKKVHLSKDEEALVAMGTINETFHENMFVHMHESVGRENSGLSLTIYDFGGQSVFHTLHHLFLTKYGIYLVVFDLTKILKDEISSLADLKFWLSSIQIHAPEAPIILVGTHMENIKSNEDQDIIDDFFDKKVKIQQQFKQVNKVNGCWFIPIDNSTKRNIDVVRKENVALANRQEFVHHPVSLRWTKTLDGMVSYKEETKADLNKKITSSSCLDIATVKRIASQYDVGSDVDVMLEFFHELGVIVHLTATDALRNYVVTDPQWLLRNIGLVLRDEKAHKKFYHLSEIKKFGLYGDLKTLLQSGIVTEDILEYFWGKHVNFLMDLMQETLLLSDWKFVDTKTKGTKGSQYLIPSMLPKGNINADFKNCCEFDFDFSDTYLPTGVFQRLVCLFIGHSCRKQTTMLPILYQKSAYIWLDSASVIIHQIQEDRISFRLADYESFQPAQFFMLVLSMFSKINEDVMHGRLKWEMFFQSDRIPYETAKSYKLEPWFGDNRNVQITDSSSIKNVDLNSFFEKFS